MEKSAERFWAEFEAETGEKVEAKAIGTHREPGDPGEGPWGLLVLTDSSFRFKPMPSENWIQSLFKSHRPSPSTPPADIVVPRGAVVSVAMPRRGFLARIFGPAFVPLEISWREGEGTAAATFAVDPSSELVARLSAAFPPSP